MSPKEVIFRWKGPSIRRLQGIAFAAAGLFLALAGSTGACPFCGSVESPPILSELDAAHTAVIVKVARTPLPTAERMRLRFRDPDAARQAATTEYRVVEQLKGEKTWAKGAAITLPVMHPTAKEEIYLMVQRNGAPEAWQIPGKLSKRGIEFVTAMAAYPPPESGKWGDTQVERLKVALRFLDSSELVLARSALAEFSMAPYAVVEKLEPVLDEKELRSWIEDKDSTASTRRLSYLLLGICGGAQERQFLKSQLELRLETARTQEVAALMAAWINLAGEEGLREIDRRFLVPKEVDANGRLAAVEALRFHYTYEDAIGKPRLEESARLLLAHPKAADQIIRNLAEWEDWDSLDAVVDLWAAHGRECAWLKRPVRDYLEACPLPAASAALAAIPPR